MRPKSGFGVLQIGCKLKKWQRRHDFPGWRHRQMLLTLFFALTNISYCPKCHVNIITASGVMIMSIYRRLTRNLEMANTLVWVLPSIWRLEWVRNIKFGTNVSTKMLLNAAKSRVTAFIISDFLRENQQGWRILGLTFRLDRNSTYKFLSEIETWNGNF